LRPFLKGIPNPDVAIFIARKALHAAVHEAAIERPSNLTTALFVEEITTLLERYLDRTSRPSAAIPMAHDPPCNPSRQF
jgi:hypothetical protein